MLRAACRASERRKVFALVIMVMHVAQTSGRPHQPVPVAPVCRPTSVSTVRPFAGPRPPEADPPLTAHSKKNPALLGEAPGP